MPKHGRYEHNWSECLRAMANIKIFATQDGWMVNLLAGRPNTTTYIDLCVTRFDQK